MNTRNKIAIGSGIIIVFLIFAYIIKMQHDIITKQNDISTKIIEFQQLGNGIARIESKMTSDRKDLELKLKDLGVNYDTIKKDLDNHNAKLEAISVSIGRTEGYVRSNIISDWQDPLDEYPNSQQQPNTNTNINLDPTCVSQHGYCRSVQGLNLYEQGINNEKIPFGAVGFNATSPTPWNLNVYPRKYYSILSMGKKPDGSVIAHSQMVIEDRDGNKHNIAIDEKSFYEQVDQTYRFSWWSPRIMAGYGIGANFNHGFSSILNMQFYTSSYTANQSRPTWMFFGLGAGYDLTNKGIIATLSPVSYNMFHMNNLIQNIYFAPIVSMSFADSSIGVHAMASLIF